MIRRFAWGWTTRNIGNGTELLIGKRNKPSDPLRQGQLVIPGGGLKLGETYQQAAMREVFEETGIQTKSPKLISGHELNMKDERVIARADKTGLIHIKYLDSGKLLTGRLVALIPKNQYKVPLEQPNSDLKKPRYALLRSLSQKLREKFTPLCQFLFKIMEK